MADHNDPNAVNSIFSDIDVSAADLYDFFGFPSGDTDGGEKVVMALTFASVPSAGVFDTDMLYRMQISGDPRVAGPGDDENTLKGLLRYSTLRSEVESLLTADRPLKSARDEW